MKKIIKTEGFGYNTEESGHHFVVYIPESSKEDIYISEHLSGDEGWKKEKEEQTVEVDFVDGLVELETDVHRELHVDLFDHGMTDVARIVLKSLGRGFLFYLADAVGNESRRRAW